MFGIITPPVGLDRLETAPGDRLRASGVPASTGRPRDGRLHRRPIGGPGKAAWSWFEGHLRSGSIELRTVDEARTEVKWWLRPTRLGLQMHMITGAKPHLPN
ncbi:hypothetical protein DFH28DRAFT_920722 [Melampsora americana]|nr:hypothetical protein DFH28DRAFT_920722 [Melampsora americana]